MLALLVGLLILLLVLPLSFVWLFLHPGTPDPIKAWTAPNGELIGLSDGRYAFDTATDRLDASLKIEAAKDLAKGDKAGAKSLWNQAVKSDTSDAEALIYLEDQRVLDSGSPYITLVVGAILTGNASDVSSGRNNLQGAYVAQKEYNDGWKLRGGRLVRLLIANAGSKSGYVAEVTEQIVQAAQQDATIIGVMGWSRSAYVQNSISLLTRAHLPMVSSTASADSLSGVSPYFFRVAPPNKSQAIAGAKYAEKQLHASRVALFVDPKNSFSSSLANDFKQQFVADGHQIADTESYTVGDKASLPALLQKALNSNPDLIYFAGYADDLAVLLVNLGTSRPNLLVLGGDSFYAPNGYPNSAKVGFSRLRFTSFAYFEEWDILGMNKPQFFSEYPNDFNPGNVDHSQNPYGFVRADYGVMLSYDAMSALFQGSQNALVAQKALTSTTLQHGLTQITGAKAMQGISGQISFGSNGDPMNKAIVILYVDPDGHIQMLEPDGVLGCFVVGQCG
jgi:ABC-type branched-subunit amino acid transport system substrate-binding protein